MSSSNSASELANQYESGEMEVNAKDGGKRSKSEQVESKLAHASDHTRKIVENAMKGEEKRKNEEKSKTEKSSK